MSIFETLMIGLESLVSNKQRSLLTMLGIIIGVASVIALQSIGQGTIDTAEQGVERTGTNLITISPANQSFGGIAQSTTNNNLTAEDATALQDTGRVSKAVAVAPENDTGGLFVAGSKTSFGQIVGTTESYPTVHSVTLTSGEWFTDTDNTASKSVVVLGATQANTLFPDGDAVGKTLQIQRVSFSVVGVMAAKGGTGFGTVDNQVFMPLTTSQKRITGLRPGGATTTGKSVSSIALKASDTNSVEQLITQATDVLRERHNTNGADDFTITNQQDQLAQAKQNQATYNTFLLVVASISLFVGGLGIMNIMLVTVTERTREIGIRKAIGATQWNILSQFMLESIILCFVGGLIGVVFGVGAALILDKTYQHTVLDISIIIIAVAFAVAVGLFFGIYPARRAAQLNPIDALRSE